MSEMPEITQNYRLRKPGPIPGVKYPVEQWLIGLQSRTRHWRKNGCKKDQPAITLVQGKHYDIEKSSMAEYLWKYRRDKGLVMLRLGTSEEGNLLLFWDETK